MATIVQVCERALGLLGIADAVTSISSPTTAREKALQRYYDSTVEYCLKYRPWAFATRYFDLTGQTGSGTVSVTSNTATFSTAQDGILDNGDTIVIGGVDYTLGAGSGTSWTLTGADVGASAFTIEKERTADPTEDWAYAYRLPSDILLPRRLVDGNRTPIRSNRPVYRVGQDADGKLLYTDLDNDVVVEYTEDVAESLWPDDFAMGVAGILAFHVAPLLAQGDPNGMGLRAYQTGLGWLNAAAAADANQDVKDDEPESDIEQYRNGGGWRLPSVPRDG